MNQSSDAVDVTETSQAPSVAAEGKRGTRCLPQVYALRDLLRRRFIHCMEQGEPFPAYAQRTLDVVERIIASQERTEVMRHQSQQPSHPSSS